MANTTKLNKLKEIHKTEEALYSERNEKYGDSFSRTFQEYGPAVVCIRLEDKLSRVKHLISNNLEGSDGESMMDTLMDLSNYANMAIIELSSSTAPEALEETPKASKKKKNKKSKVEDTESTTQEAGEEGPLDGLSKRQLIEIISQLGGAVSRKATREKMISIINEFPKARVAVAVTSLAPVDSTGEEENGEEE